MSIPTTTTWGTTTANWIGSTVNAGPSRSPLAKEEPPKPKTSIDWLRDRVQEVCDLAFAA